MLRQPPASSCSFCPINSSFGGYFFPRNENKLCTHPRRPQRRIQTNSRWQAESCVNTTERLSCAHRLLEHAPKLQRSPAALHLFLNLALVGLCSNQPARQCPGMQGAPHTREAHLPASSSTSPALPQHHEAMACISLVQLLMEGKKKKGGKMRGNATKALITGFSSTSNLLP